MKIWMWFVERMLVFWYFWRWFFGFDEIEPEPTNEHLPTILELRHENFQLKAKNEKLMAILENLTDSGFDDDPADVNLERLKSQFGMFFVRSGLDALPAEEFHFLRKTFLDSLSCAFVLGTKKNDRSAKSTS